MQSNEHMHNRRLYELQRCLPFFQHTKSEAPKLLEIGAGTGFQARVLSDTGLDVTAVEISSSPYQKDRRFKIINYDGAHLPFSDHVFDFVFSSNVLEHVPDVAQLLTEIRRVLKPNGLSVHVMPTSGWRLWSNITHYPWVLKRFMTLLTGRNISSPTGPRRPRTPKSSSTWIATIFPSRHGEHGNVVTEVYWFSAKIWRRRFTAAGFIPVSELPTGLFYTNAALFGGALSIATRRQLAHVLGSACRIYVARSP
jgi:SAM-dependent methyltransferase